MFCSRCGTKLDANAKFCSSCGNPVGHAKASTPEPVGGPQPVAESVAAPKPAEPEPAELKPAGQPVVPAQPAAVPAPQTTPVPQQVVPQPAAAHPAVPKPAAPQPAAPQPAAPQPALAVQVPDAGGESSSLPLSSPVQSHPADAQPAKKKAGAGLIVTVILLALAAVGGIAMNVIQVVNGTSILSGLF